MKIVKKGTPKIQGFTLLDFYHTSHGSVYQRGVRQCRSRF